MTQLIVAEYQGLEYFGITALEEFLLGRSRCRPLTSPGLHSGMSYCPQAEREALFGKLKRLYDSGMYKKLEKLFNKVRKHWLRTEEEGHHWIPTSDDINNICRSTDN